MGLSVKLVFVLIWHWFFLVLAHWNLFMLKLSFLDRSYFDLLYFFFRLFFCFLTGYSLFSALFTSSGMIISFLLLLLFFFPAAIHAVVVAVRCFNFNFSF